MNTKSKQFDAVRRLSMRAEQTLARANAYEALFLAEAGRLLFEALQDKRDADGCIGAFDEFLIECGLSRRTAPALALEICSLAAKEGLALPVFSRPDLPPPGDVCFVKNRFTEEVLPLLDEQMGVYYAESFEEACALTAEGARQGCLVPYMGQDHVPLPGIARLIDEYDLKKHRLFVLDNDRQNTAYLLLCNEIRKNPAADQMELMAAGPRGEIEQLIALSKNCDLLCDLPSPLRGLSNPTSREEPVFCRFTLKGKIEDLLLFSGVVKLCLPDSMIAGLYDTVELLEE